MSFILVETAGQTYASELPDDLEIAPTPRYSNAPVGDAPVATSFPPPAPLDPSVLSSEAFQRCDWRGWGEEGCGVWHKVCCSFARNHTHARTHTPPCMSARERLTSG